MGAQRIASELQARITDGEWPPGGRLPSVRDLMDQYDVSTQTVQRALSALRADGAVEVRQGVGVFVRVPTEVTEVPLTLDRALRDGESERIAAVGPVGAPRFAADLLGIETGAVVIERRSAIVRERLGPVELVTAYYPMDVADGTALARREVIPDGTVAELARLGFPAGSASVWVGAPVGRREERSELGVRTGISLLRAVRQARTAAGRAVEVAQFVMSAERYVVQFEL
jgi:GntR family transcriptional regulator